MMSIQPLKIEQTEGAVQETLSAVKSKLGMVPNLFAVMAKAPAILNSYLQFSENLKNGKLPAQTGERVAIAIATRNSCDYCLSAHTALGKMAGIEAAELVAAQDGRSSQVQAQAALTLAQEINRTHGAGAGPALVEALKAGLSEQEVLEIAGHVALNILTNTINGLAETQIDFPRVSRAQAVSV